MADRAQEDRVEVAQLVDGAGRQDLARPQVALAAEIEILRFVRDAFERRHGLEDLECLRASLPARSHRRQ